MLLFDSVIAILPDIVDNPFDKFRIIMRLVMAVIAKAYSIIEIVLNCIVSPSEDVMGIENIRLTPSAIFTAITGSDFDGLCPCFHYFA
jgi:hypothetical protein